MSSQEPEKQKYSYKYTYTVPKAPASTKEEPGQAELQAYINEILGLKRMTKARTEEITA